MLKLYLTCHRGFEKEAARELASLGLGPVKISGGGLEASGEIQAVGVIKNGSRLVNHVYQRLDTYRVRNMSDHFMRCLRYPWEQLFDVKQSFAVSSQFVGAEQVVQDFRNSHFFALRTKDAIADRFRQMTGLRPSVDLERPDVRIHVVLVGESVFVYRDLVGKSLHQRGYRRMPGAAPLKETLAASLIAAVRWDPATEPLVDPMCGSGTIVIEAGVMARKLGVETPVILGYDADPESIKRAEVNLTTAQGLTPEFVPAPVTLAVSRMEEVVPPEGRPGVVVLNAPYGERLDSSPETVFRNIASALEARWKGYRVALLGPEGTGQFLSRPRVGGAKKGYTVREVRKIRNGPILCEMILLGL